MLDYLLPWKRNNPLLHGLPCLEGLIDIMPRKSNFPSWYMPSFLSRLLYVNQFNHDYHRPARCGETQSGHMKYPISLER